MLCATPLPLPLLVSVPWVLPQIVLPDAWNRLKARVSVLTPVPLMKRVVPLEPVPVPELRPTLYGVVLVQVTFNEVFAVTAVASTPWELPKFRLLAAMVQSAMMVTGSSNGLFMLPLRQSAAPARWVAKGRGARAAASAGRYFGA